MFHNIVEHSEILNKCDCLKTCIQTTNSISFCIICRHFPVGKMEFFNFSFKIAMSGQAGVGRRPWLTFWLPFFLSYMLPLFFSGLLSYLVGMQRRTSRCIPCKRDNSHSSLFKKPVHNFFGHFSCFYIFLISS